MSFRSEELEFCAPQTGESRAERMDILLGDVDVKAEKMKVRSQKAKAKSAPSVTGQQAPIELMSEFLLKVSGGEIREARELCEVILKYEPNNAMMRDFKVSMAEYVRQGLDQEDEEEEVEDYEDEEEEEEEDEEDTDEEVKGVDKEDGSRVEAGFKMTEAGSRSDAKSEGKSAEAKGSGERWRHSFA